MKSVHSELWKKNRKEKALENEVYIMKESFCRISKRLFILENFLKSKFAGEFPPVKSGNYIYITEVSVQQPDQFSSQNNSSAETYHNFNIKGASEVQRDNEINKDPLGEAEKLSSDAEEHPIDNDWDANFISGDTDPPPSPMGVEIEIEPEYHNDTEVEGHHDDLDEGDISDVNAEEPANKSVEMEKTGESIAAQWLLGGENYSSDVKQEKKNVRFVRGRAKTSNATKQPQGIIHSRTCDICKRVFTGKKCGNLLRQHREIHSFERKYKCRHCDKTFKQRRPLRTHEMRVHNREKNLIFQCKYCGKKFITAIEKDHHERIHTGEKPYSCDICGYKSAQLSNITRHKTTHLTENTHLCTSCGKAFKTELQLKRHEKSMHDSQNIGADGKKERHISCELCTSAFFQVRGLRQHMKKMHGIDVPLKTSKSLCPVKKEIAGSSTTFGSESSKIKPSEEIAKAVESIQSHSSSST